MLSNCVVRFHPQPRLIPKALFPHSSSQCRSLCFPVRANPSFPNFQAKIPPRSRPFLVSCSPCPPPEEDDSVVNLGSGDVDEVSQGDSEFGRFLNVMNSLMFSCLGRMRCNELHQYTDLMRAIKHLKCINAQKCLHEDRCRRLQECFLFSKLHLDVSADGLTCIDPKKCLKRDECSRGNTDVENQSIVQTAIFYAVCFITTLDPMVLMFVFVIGFVLAIPDSTIIGFVSRTSATGVVNKAQFWKGAPRMFTPDWFAKKFNEHRASMFKLGQDYGKFVPRWVTQLVDKIVNKQLKLNLALERGFPVSIFGWFVTIACFLSSLVQLVRISIKLAFSIWMWLANNINNAYRRIRPPQED